MKKIIYVFAIVFAFVALLSCKETNRPGEIHGTITYCERDLQGAVITLTGDNGTYTYTSNAAGYYVIRDIVPGDYIVSVSYNGKNVDSYLVNYEQSDNPHKVTIDDNGFHVRNIVIPESEDLGWGEEEEDEYELPEAELPILAWYSVPGGDDATLENYQTLKDCGFTLSFSHLYNMTDALASLDLADEVGMKVIFTCGDELRTNTEAVVNQVKDHPALYGYFLRDEPSNADLPALGEWADRIRAVDPDHAIYFNLFPFWAGEDLIGGPYEEHVQNAIETIKPTQVSFDCYPITTNGINNDWWYNLEVIKRQSDAANLPIWAFALATAHSDYPVPTLADLRLQMYTNLAYGAQCLQYFTYWCPGTETWNFHEAPINDDGTKSSTYDVVREMNQELQARAGVFVGATVKQVRYAETVPYGGTKLEDYPSPLSSFNANGCRTLVSLIENGEYEYLMLVNCSNTAGYNFRIGFERKVQIVNRDGSIEPMAENPADFYIEEGDCTIFCWRK